MKLSEIKKILLKKGFRIYKLPKNSARNDFKSLYFTSLFGFFLIIFFFILPDTVRYTASYYESYDETHNKSKRFFEKTMSGKETKKLSKKIIKKFQSGSK